jgi:hypothetical protein
MDGIAPYNPDMVTYVSAALRRADPTLFPGDLFAASSAAAITPQFLNDLLLIGVMKLGLSWLAAALVIYLLCAAVLAGGLVALAAAISRRHTLPIAAFLSLMVAHSTFGDAIGRNWVWMNSWVNQSMATALSVWALALALRSRWRGAGAVLAATALFHPQVGLYTTTLVAIWLVVKTHRRWRWAPAAPLLAPVVAMAAIQVAFSLTSSARVLSGRDFVAVYAALRHPTLLLPSTWYWPNAVLYLAVVGCALLAVLLAAARPARLAAWRDWGLPTLWLLAAGGVIVAGQYVFTELAPVALVPQLYPERYFGSFRIWVCLVFAAALGSALERSKVWLALALPVLVAALQWYYANFALSPSLLPAAAITILAVAQSACAAHRHSRPGAPAPAGAPAASPDQLVAAAGAAEPVVVPGAASPDALAAATGPELLRSSAGAVELGLLPGPGARPAPGGPDGEPLAAASPEQLVAAAGAAGAAAAAGRARPGAPVWAAVGAWVGAVCLALGAAVGAGSAFLIWSEGELRVRQWAEFANPPPVTAEDAQALAGALPPDAAFLADPMEFAYSALHLYGQRTLAASFKNIPIDGAAMAEWLERLERLGAVERVGSGYQETGSSYEAIPVADLAVIAAEFGADYLVTGRHAEQRYLDSEAVELVARSPRFAIFRIR